MSIRVKQIGRLANSVISQFLQGGQFPSMRAVIAQVFDRLNGPGGVPRTRAPKLKPGSLTDPAALNALTTAVHEDVQNLYDEAVDQVNRIVRDYDAKGTRRERLAQRLIEVSGKLNSAIAGQTQGVIGSFETIDFARTDAEIDFRSYRVTLPPASNGVAKIDLSGAQITTDAPSTAAVVGSPSDIATDLIDQVYFVRLASAQNSASLTITVKLGDPTTLSSIVAVGHVGSQCTASLSIDGSMLETQTIDLSRRAQWQIPAKSVQTLVLTLTKTQPDIVQGATNYFDFGLKSLSCYLEEYVPAATFTTMPIDLGEPIGTLTLAANQEIPANCDIEWALSTGGAFAPLTPGKPVAISTLVAGDQKRVYPVRTVRDLVRVNTLLPYTGPFPGAAGAQSDAGVPVLAPVRGGRTPLFTLCEIGSEAFQTKVWRGRNAWKVRSYHYSIGNTSGDMILPVITRGADPGYIADPPPTLADFDAPRGGAEVYMRFQPTEFDIANQYTGLDADASLAIRYPRMEQPVNGADDRVMHCFEANLVVDATIGASALQALSSTVVTMPGIFAANRGAVYLNGKPVHISAQGSGSAVIWQCILNLQAGTNLLQIVTNNYAAIGGQPFNVGTTVFSSLCAYGGNVAWYAEPGPLTPVSLFELQYQTARNDFSRYAIVENTSGTGQMIVVRELPTCLYDVTAKTLSDAGAPSSVTLQARLSGSPFDKSLSPIITGYAVSTEYV